MQQVSTDFMRALRRPHRTRTWASIVDQNRVSLQRLPVVQGELVRDTRSAQYASLHLNLGGPVALNTATASLAKDGPAGYEIQVTTGVEVGPVGSELWEDISLGMFPIQETDIDGVSLAATISASDRSQLLRDARFVAPYTVAGSLSYAFAVLFIVRDTVGDSAWAGTAVSPELQAVSTVGPVIFPEQGDPWEAIRTFATGAGCLAYFDEEGNLIVEPSRTAPDRYSWAVVDGVSGSLLQPQAGYARGDTYNQVVAASQNGATGASYRGVATDLSTGSPTFYGGRFGKKTRFYYSPLFTSNAQCQVAASTILRQSMGLARTLDLSVAPNPALDPLDRIYLRSANLGLDELAEVDRIALSFGRTNAMRCSVRTNLDTPITLT